MSDIRTVQYPDDGHFDWLLDRGDVVGDDGLESAVIISLFSDQRASDDDVESLGLDDRRGWWGDGFAGQAGDQIGSGLWLLQRSKQTADVVERARNYAATALQWLVDDGIAQGVSVYAEVTKPGMLGLQIEIRRKRRPTSSYQFGVFWAGRTPTMQQAIESAQEFATLIGGGAGGGGGGGGEPAGLFGAPSFLSPTSSQTVTVDSSTFNGLTVSAGQIVGAADLSAWSSSAYVAVITGEWSMASGISISFNAARNIAPIYSLSSFSVQMSASFLVRIDMYYDSGAGTSYVKVIVNGFVHTVALDASVFAAGASHLFDYVVDPVNVSLSVDGVNVYSAAHSGIALLSSYSGAGLTIGQTFFSEGYLPSMPFTITGLQVH